MAVVLLNLKTYIVYNGSDGLFLPGNHELYL